jgi:hypothetical protein
LQILHHALFHASPSVRDYLFSNGVDPEILQVADNVFFARVASILPAFFEYRPTISAD